MTLKGILGANTLKAITYPSSLEWSQDGKILAAIFRPFSEINKSKTDKPSFSVVKDSSSTQALDSMKEKKLCQLVLLNTQNLPYCGTTFGYSTPHMKDPNCLAFINNNPAAIKHAFLA